MTNSDWFTRAFGNAVADVRSVLIEEGWFNRRESPMNHSPAGYSQEQESRSSPDAERDPLGRTGEPERDHEREVGREPGHGIEIDR